MISCLEWVPKGAADPAPKRYEMSAAELEMLQHQAELEEKLRKGEDSDDEKSVDAKNKSIEKVENNLPADLRMDEYSSDEDETNVGKLLLGKVCFFITNC